VRAVAFRGGEEVLLVKEKIDQGRWTVPGGWADVGLTPFEVAVKEVLEETGLEVRPVRLLALFDKSKHEHPPQPWYVYKVFIQVEVIGGESRQETEETAGAGWFRQDELGGLDLSLDRVTQGQMDALFPYARQPQLAALCD
jgi:ADP-ribose pyrophosphatase YjhB (NUDIX family)